MPTWEEFSRLALVENRVQRESATLRNFFVVIEHSTFNPLTDLVRSHINWSHMI